MEYGNRNEWSRQLGGQNQLSKPHVSRLLHFPSCYETRNSAPARTQNNQLVMADSIHALLEEELPPMISMGFTQHQLPPPPVVLKGAKFEEGYNKEGCPLESPQPKGGRVHRPLNVFIVSICLGIHSFFQ